MTLTHRKSLSLVVNCGQRKKNQQTNEQNIPFVQRINLVSFFVNSIDVRNVQKIIPIKILSEMKIK